MTSKFRSKIWDPLLIISQIISLQFQFYSTLLLFVCTFNSFSYYFLSNENYKTYSLNHIFDHRSVNFKNANNTFVSLSFILNSLLRFVVSCHNFQI